LKIFIDLSYKVGYYVYIETNVNRGNKMNNKKLATNFDFFNYTAKLISNDRKKEISEVRELNTKNNNEKLVKRIARNRYMKSLAIQLG